MSRFGSNTNKKIDEIIEANQPKNTLSNKRFVWKTFMEFCNVRKYEIDENRTVEELALILKDWAINMRKRDGSDFKETTIKTMWNLTSKILQIKYYKDYKVIIDPFKSVVFQQARAARDSIRRILQSDACKRKQSSVALSSIELSKMINFWNENTPEGLQRKFYHIAAVELAWRGGEASACLTDFFHTETNNDDSLTNRIEYNPIFSKTCQGGSGFCTDSKYLVKNNDTNVCPVRLFKKLISKRGSNIKSKRLFMRPNRYWKKETDHWYDNMPIGKNIIQNWTKSTAEAIGLNTKEKKITNHSNRSTAVSRLLKNGVQEQELIKITGHNNTNSIKPYLNIDLEHHNKIINSMRGNKACVVETNTSGSSFNFSNCSFVNCTFK